MVTRPQAGNSAQTLASIVSLCDAADAAASSLVDLLSRVGAVEGAVGAEVQARSQAIATEVQARQTAVIQEADGRQAAIAAAVKSLTAQIAALGDGLRAAINAEATSRSNADAAEQEARRTAVAAQAQALADAIDRLEGLIAGKAAASDLQQAIAAQAAALRDAVAQLSGASDALRFEFVPNPGRPGDAPGRFTLVPTASTLGGARSALPVLPPNLIASGDAGPVVRVSGSGVLAARNAFAIEPGRLYRSRYVIQRRANPADPSGDAVVCGVVYLDQSIRVLGPVVPVRSYPALITANGRQECEALIARSAGLGAAFQAPASARFMVSVVALYGPDALTDVEVLSVEDVTGAFVLAPPIANFEARLAALEAADLTARLQALEAEAGTPSKLTFGSKGDASYAAIPDSVQVVELLGRQFAGDGGGGRYVRTAAQVPDGADSFTCHGAVFLRETIAPDVVASMLESGFVTWASGLPREAPAKAGNRWLNNGSPTITLTDSP